MAYLNPINWLREVDRGIRNYQEMKDEIVANVEGTGGIIEELANSLPDASLTVPGTQINIVEYRPTKKDAQGQPVYQTMEERIQERIGEALDPGGPPEIEYMGEPPNIEQVGIDLFKEIPFYRKAAKNRSSPMDTSFKVSIILFDFHDILTLSLLHQIEPLVRVFSFADAW